MRANTIFSIDRHRTPPKNDNREELNKMSSPRRKMTLYKVYNKLYNYDFYRTKGKTIKSGNRKGVEQ